MTMRDKPPFRADHVGSLLRPRRLLEAREKFLGPQTPDQHLGPHGNADLRAVEDECIREVVAMQEAAGHVAASDEPGAVPRRAAVPDQDDPGLAHRAPAGTWAARSVE